MDPLKTVDFLIRTWCTEERQGLQVWPLEYCEDGFSCTVDSRYGILLRCSTHDIPLFRRGSLRMEGLSVSNAAAGVQSVLAVTCADRRLFRAMSWLCFELLNLRPAKGIWRAEEVAEHIKDWAKLLRGRRGDEALSLVGELLVMRKLVEEHGVKAWDWWDGPKGGRHDIVTPDLCIEVKTTSSRTGWRVTMHGLHQATLPGDGRPLFLDCVRVERIKQGGFQLKDLFEGIPAGIFPEILMEDLAASGDLDGPRWQLIEAVRFPINENFPKIGPQDFIGGALPDRVVGFEYTIDLGGVPCTAIDLNFKGAC